MAEELGLAIADPCLKHRTPVSRDGGRAPTSCRPPRRRGGRPLAVRRVVALVNNRTRLAGAIDELVELLSQREVIDQIPDTNRDNLARYLTVTKLKLENAIAIIRATREA